MARLPFALSLVIFSSGFIYRNKRIKCDQQSCEDTVLHLFSGGNSIISSWRTNTYCSEETQRKEARAILKILEENEDIDSVALFKYIEYNAVFEKKKCRNGITVIKKETFFVGINESFKLIKMIGVNMQPSVTIAVREGKCAIVPHQSQVTKMRSKTTSKVDFLENRFVALYENSYLLVPSMGFLRHVHQDEIVETCNKFPDSPTQIREHLMEAACRKVVGEWFYQMGECTQVPPMSLDYDIFIALIELVEEEIPDPYEKKVESPTSVRKPFPRFQSQDLSHSPVSFSNLSAQAPSFVPSTTHSFKPLRMSWDR